MCRNKIYCHRKQDGRTKIVFVLQVDRRNWASVKNIAIVNVPTAPRFPRPICGALRSARAIKP
jgi:hypothetical protein